MTAPAHPIVFRPVIERLRAAGHDVEVTARDYAQTLGLLERLRIEHHVIGRHGGASWLRIPAVNTFDYEWATYQHQIGCRLARRVMVPEAIPPERLARYGVGPAKLRRYPGLKEEYYLADFTPDDTVLD